MLHSLESQKTSENRTNPTLTSTGRRANRVPSCTAPSSRVILHMLGLTMDVPKYSQPVL